MGDLDAHLTHDSLGPSKLTSSQRKLYLGRSAVFAGLTTVIDRQTDHATRSVTTGRIYVRSRPTAMRPNNMGNYS